MTKVPEIPISTHFFEQRYLFAFATQAEVLHHVRTQSLEEESARLPEILRAWEGLRPRVEQLNERERDIAESCQLVPVADEHHEAVGAFTKDELFQKTFAGHAISFAVVEADKLIAPQRTVHLGYVKRLAESYPKSPSMRELLDICVSPKRMMDPIQHLEVVPNVHVFSSPNSDIRFLGAFVKKLTADDLQYAVGGGLPAAAVIAFVGYGVAPVNVLLAGRRVVLNNGFHRVYTLRSLGISRIPVVVQHIRNVELEFPPAVAGLPKEYLLKVPRPVLIKDFFEPDFSITLKARERIKMVAVGISPNQHDVPA